MRFLYISLLLLTSLLWAGNFIVSKSLVDHASPMTLTNLRWIIAILVLFPIVWFTEKKLLPSRKAIIPLFFMGVAGVALFNLFQFMALEHTSATNVGLISTLNPIAIALFSFIFLKEKINILQILAMSAAFIGVLLVLSEGHLESLLSFQFNKGDFFMIVASYLWGIYSVCSKWALTYTSPMLATLYSGIFGVTVFLPFNITSFTITNINLSFIQAILYTGLISTVLCMVLWNIGVQKIGATTAGLFLNFNPIFTAILAFLFLQEKMTDIQFIGSAIVIIGCYLFSLFQNKSFLRKKTRVNEVLVE